LLWYGFHEVNEPEIKSPDYLHPSVYGAYLNGLVLFQEITGKDVRIFGDQDVVAIALGVPGPVAAQLQQIAWEAVTLQDHAPVHQVIDPCTVTH
jgi:hypothetical protein